MNEKHILRLYRQNGQLKYRLDKMFKPCDVIDCEYVINCKTCPIYKHRKKSMTLSKILDILRVEMGLNT
jgi:hypothetical protein